MRVLAGFLCALFAGQCAAQQSATPAAPIGNYEAPGNLQTTHKLDCIALADITNQLTPADLFPAARKCIESEQYQKAANLAAVAGLYGRYDMMRVSDRTAHQAVTVLRMNNFGSVDPKRMETFQQAMKPILAPDSKELIELCEQVKGKGAPAYVPTYMIQHGMGAFTGTGGLRADFDSKAGWAASLDAYLHCPK